MVVSRLARLGAQLGQGVANPINRQTQVDANIRNMGPQMDAQLSGLGKKLEFLKGLSPDELLRLGIDIRPKAGGAGDAFSSMIMAILANSFGGPTMGLQQPVITPPSQGSPGITQPPPIIPPQPKQEWEGLYDLGGQGYAPSSKAEADTLVNSGAKKVQ